MVITCYPGFFYLFVWNDFDGFIYISVWDDFKSSEPPKKESAKKTKAKAADKVPEEKAGPDTPAKK